MQPYDGNGYGISSYWDSQANVLAKMTGEHCGHDSIKATIESDTSKPYFIDANIECQQCDADYPDSKKKLVDEYLKFYGMKV